MKISTFFYTLWQGVRNLFRNGWYTLASVATISACLFLFGMFFAVVKNVQTIVKNVEVKVTVFFNEDVSDQRIADIGAQIKAHDGVDAANTIFHEDDEIWAEFGPAYFGDDYLEGFPEGENPLKGEHNWEITLNDASKQEAVVTWLRSFTEVRRINYSEYTANTLTGMSSLVTYVSIAIIAILLAVSIFLISNTVRVGIAVRAEEISIMKYVGATDFFVRAPFVLEGMLIGLLGAGIPILIIRELYGVAIDYLNNKFSSLGEVLTFIELEQIQHILVPACLIVGVGIGFLGSLASVRKHLRV